MVLPELPMQFVYGRLAWGLVLAALLVAAWPATRRLPRRVLAAIALACLLVMALPGSASPAWSLLLAFQYPSGLLVGLCIVKLHARWRHAAGGAGLRGQSAMPALPVLPAAVLALSGALVYLDAFGLLARGYYYAGFAPGAAPLAAIILAVACVAAILRGRAVAQACALLGAVALFSLARLPTGNVWDALLDPLLWGWSLATVGLAAVRALRRRATRPRPARPAAGVAR